MTTPTTTPADLDDDSLAELLADAVVAQAAHNPRLCRLALRAAGLRKAPADMTQDELAAEWGMDRAALNRIALRALAKLRYSPEITHLKGMI